MGPLYATGPKILLPFSHNILTEVDLGASCMLMQRSSSHRMTVVDLVLNRFP